MTTAWATPTGTWGGKIGIFMIDASSGDMKDGPENRLRDVDMHRIVDVFSKRLDQPGYARMVPLAEIEKTDFKPNRPRCIDTPKAVIAALAEDLPAHYASKPLTSAYDVNQHLMYCRAATMQDAGRRAWRRCATHG